MIPPAERPKMLADRLVRDRLTPLGIGELKHALRQLASEQRKPASANG